MTTGKTKLDIVVSLNELITVELEKSDPVSVTHLWKKKKTKKKKRKWKKKKEKFL